MALKTTFLAGWNDGEHAVDVDGSEYVAGQPAKLTSTGWQLATSPADVLGLFKNDMSVDTAGGPQAADEVAEGFAIGTVVMGVNKVQMTAGTLVDGSTARTPFKYPGSATWAVGDKLYVDATGLWDNAAETAGDPPFGIVTLAPTSATGSLEAVMLGLTNSSGTGADFAGLLSADATGRAIMAASYFNAATVSAKFAAASIGASKLIYFKSTEATGTGASQNIAHGLAGTPSLVWWSLSEHPGTPDTGAFDVAEGAHDATNLKFTVTTNVKFYAFAVL